MNAFIPNPRRRDLVYVATFFSVLQSGKAFSAGITAMTQGAFALNRGDQIVIEAQPSSPNSRVEWWSGGELICEQSRCVIDTSSYTPGEYKYEVIVSDGEGIATAGLSVSATDSPPLYVPKTVNPPVQGQISGLTVVKNGEWMIVARAGAITTPNARNPINPIRVISVSSVIDGAVYSVSGGSQAIARRIGFNEQWLISSGSSFKFRQNSFELLSGQGIWRVLQSDRVTSSIARVAGAEIRSSGDVFLGVSVGQSGEGAGRVLVRDFEGDKVTLSCAGGAAESLERRSSKVVNLGNSGVCISIDSQVFNAGDPAPMIRAWSPWWIGRSAPTSADRWRAEWGLLKDSRSEGLILADALAAQKSRRCADALDLAGVRVFGAADRGKFIRLQGDCQFDLGLYARSLATFIELGASGADPAWAAFMIARSHQMSGHHKLALQWFRESLKRGFEDKISLARFAVQASISDENSIERLRWLEVASIYETDDTRYPRDFQDVAVWRAHRPSGSVVKGLMFMDSQALPVNSKKISVMPQNSKMSRSLVFGATGDWWTTRPLSNDLNFIVSGSHDLFIPKESSISFASRSVQEVSAGFAMGGDVDEGYRPVDRWTGRLLGRLGTGLSGGERQRDRMGWSATVGRPSWNNLTFGLKSDKFLDPKPGGADVIDLDLNRYTGEADHSHLDLIFLIKASAASGIYLWSVDGEYGNVDYRTGVMDQFDYSLIKLSAKLGWAVARRVQLFLDPEFMSRAYKDGGGTDQTTGAHLGARVLASPLWTVIVDAAMENRAVSKDQTSSWSRLIYGLGVAAEI